MAKKTNVRVASVDERVATLVDRGCEIDYELKNLTVEEKGTKKIIGDEAAKLLQAGEMTVKLEGTRAFATVAVIEKYEIDASKEEFNAADLGIKSGAFREAVTVVKTLAVPPDKVEQACELLKRAGVSAMVQVSYDIDAKEMRVLLDSKPVVTEMQAAVAALKKCAVCKTSTRVSYEKKDN